MGKAFVRLDYTNMGRMYNEHKLIRGSLVKYRFNHDIINSYGLNSQTNHWSVGVVSKINWYVMTPSYQYVVGETKNEEVYYDISVHNVSDANGIEIINLKSNEIFLLTD